jgi:hypothetical protein
MNPPENNPVTSDDDGMEWLRQIRRDMLAEAGGDPLEMGRRLQLEAQNFKGRVIKYEDRNAVTAHVAEDPPTGAPNAEPSDARKVPYDDGLEWLRQIRRDMLAEAGGDPVEMGRRLREAEKDYPSGFIRAANLSPEQEARIKGALADAKGSSDIEYPA